MASGASNRAEITEEKAIELANFIEPIHSMRVNEHGMRRFFLSNSPYMVLNYHLWLF